MALKRRPYDLIMLMTLEFLLVVLTFYTASVMMLISYQSDADLLLNIGTGASQILIENSRQISLLLGVMFGILAAVTGLLLWGLLRAKRWSYQVGIEASVVLIIANIIALFLFGVGNIQLALRLGISIVLPLVVIYYLRKKEIKAYLLD
jgi:hypothetical protein